MNKQMLIDLLSCSREGQVFNIAKKALSNKMDCVHDAFGDYCFFTPAKGKPVLPILLVAHVDTVNYDKKRVKVIEDHGVLINKNGILGADDRAGVFIILELVKKLQAVPYVLLTSGEEIGGIGVKSFCDSGLLEKHLPDINMFIEFDRRGVNQYVTYCNIPVKFEQFFEDYGYEKHHGSYSDVATLSRHFKIGHVNLSAGYFNEHTASEYCSLSGVRFAINNAAKILPLIREKALIEEKPVFLDYPVKKRKKSKAEKAKDAEYETWWAENYGPVNGKSFKSSCTCPFCGSDNTQEVDYQYRYCNGCKDYYVEGFDGLAIVDDVL